MLWEELLPWKSCPVSMDCNSLVEYLEKFDIPLEAMNTVQNIKAATVDVMKSASKEGVRYIEIRFAPLLSCLRQFEDRGCDRSCNSRNNEGSNLF